MVTAEQLNDIVEKAMRGEAVLASEVMPLVEEINLLRCQRARVAFLAGSWEGDSLRVVRDIETGQEADDGTRADVWEVFKDTQIMMNTRHSRAVMGALRVGCDG